MATEEKLTLDEAATSYLSALAAEDHDKAQADVMRFVRWYGPDKSILDMTAPMIGDYAEHIASSISDPVKKLEPVRAFLSYLRKEKLIKTSLAPELRVRKAVTSKSKTAPATKSVRDQTISLTREGHARMEAELKTLIAERPRIAEEIHKAAADKDFRENAPLDAAREHQGQIEARIRALEHTLKCAVIMDENAAVTSRVTIGNTVVLKDLSTGNQVTYTLVSPTEANPLAGKVSTASPLGKAMIGSEAGQTIEFHAPAGVRQYQINEIKQ
jgi:transcription elongation factor GreA